MGQFEAVRTKICGLTRETDVAAAVDVGADATGFVVDVPVETPREIAPETAAALVETVPPFTTTVLVTFPNNVESLIETVGADAVQIHGDIDLDRLAALRSGGTVRVIKTVQAGDREAALQYAAVADAIHVDSTDDSGGGGTGRTHDWDETAALRRAVDGPLVLSGGLSPTNVGAAVRTVRPYAVDVASGVERRGGVKDHEAVNRFVRNARREATTP